jgi:hypothetical protein
LIAQKLGLNQNLDRAQIIFSKPAAHVKLIHHRQVVEE